jgi:CheY-like chemotaxis protein
MSSDQPQYESRHAGLAQQQARALSAYAPSCSVLIVDPNEVSRDILAITLEQAGYATPVVGTIADAEAAVRYGRPDLVMQSLTLSDGNWWELAARLPRLGNVPILGYSCVMPIEARGSFKHGFAGFLTKPFAPAYLVRSLPFYLFNKPIPEAAPPQLSASSLDTLKGQATIQDHPGQKERVLIAEDNEFQRERLQKAFVQAGFEVTVARHGIEALEKLAKSRPDVLVSDTLMTGCDGFELCLAVRRLASLKNLPIILTAPNHVDPIDERVALALGADAYVGRSNGFERLIEGARLAAKLSRSNQPARLSSI